MDLSRLTDEQLITMIKDHEKAVKVRIIESILAGQRTSGMTEPQAKKLNELRNEIEKRGLSYGE